MRTRVFEKEDVEVVPEIKQYWEYNGKDYKWSNQFDCIMIADIDLGETDTLPVYLGLLVKDEKVAAITFYYPTAD